MNNKSKQILASRLKALRLESGFTQEQLADAAGIDRKTINRIENGHFSPSVDSFFRIAHALSVAPDSIMKGIKA
jgi:transcriptional regulator with XRE-family HTH domain